MKASKFQAAIGIGGRADLQAEASALYIIGLGNSLGCLLRRLVSSGRFLGFALASGESKDAHKNDANGFHGGFLPACR